MSDRFEKHARTVTLLTLLSRITGLVRDAALSRIFGAGPLMSAFFFAFMIPNLFRRLFGEGALSAAFLPEYARLRETDLPRSRALASLVVSRLALVVGGITLLAEAAMLLVMSQVGGDHLALRLMAIMLPYMPMICLVALLGAMLQVRGRFGPTAASPVLLNGCLIAATLLLAPRFAARGEAAAVQHVMLISLSVLLAGALQLLWTILALRDESWWTKDQTSARGDAAAVLRRAGPVMVSLGVLQLNTFVDGLIASYPVTFSTRTFFAWEYPLDEAAMTVLSFAQRLYQFPLGVFGIAIATAIFPLLSRQAHDEAAFRSTLRRGLRLVIFIGLPASIGLLLVQRPLSAVLYEGGEFSPADTARVAVVLAGYAPSIWAYSMAHLLTRAFYARGDSRRPMRIALAVVALNFLLNCTLIWFLREAGLAWSTSICAIVQVMALLVLLGRQFPGLIDASVRRSWARTAVMTAAMAGTLAGVEWMMPPSVNWSGHVVKLAILVASGALTVTLVALALRMPEFRWGLGGAARSGE